jgi:diacylglycerol kinase family enzyme
MIPAFVNPLAGDAGAAHAALSAVGAFDIREASPASLSEQVRRAVDEGAQRVLIAGGDGSIGIAADVVGGTGVELAILPCGTLNHLARDLSLPLDLEQAAKIAAAGRVLPVDAASLNDRVFLNTSAVGAYVMFVRARNRLERRLGYHLASFVAAARLLVRLPTFRIALAVNGVQREYITPLVFIGVGERELKLPVLGKRVLGGKPGLHVMVLHTRSGARAVALVLAAAARGVDAMAKTPAMDSFLVTSCRLEPRMRTAAADGELVKVVPPLRYNHLPGHLRIVVPEATQ